MPKLTRRTVTLGQSQNDFIEAKIASGDYVSASEVVRAGIAALAERDAALERWLQTEVAATYDHLEANPSDVMDLDEAFAMIRGDDSKRAAA
jgi:antitoxin ParD1/3/4